VAASVLGSSLLSWRYGVAAPRALLIEPQDLRARDASFWPEVESGTLGLAGSFVDLGDVSIFETVAPTQAWQRSLHAFDWLRHVEAARDPDAEAWARDVVLDWLERRRSHPAVSMAPEIRARRIIAWISSASFLLDGAEADEFDRIARGMSLEVLRLSAGWRTAPEGEARLTALTALTLARLAFDDEDTHLGSVVGLLGAEIQRQVLPDGGHISRNPAALIEVLLDWLPLKTCFEARNLPVPERLAAGIERALGMLRFLRLGDGGIARFNGMGIADPGAIATLMAYNERPVPTWGIAPSSRYARLSKGGVTLLVDAGAPPRVDASGEAHAGCLSIEVSTGSALLFVNVGAPGPPDADWRSLSRATASHSTACLGETSSAHLLRHGGIAELMHAVPLFFPGTVRGEVTVDEVGARFEGSHDGYAARTGLLHRRSLSLSASGDRIEGCDRFEQASRSLGANEVPFALHFHLHPGSVARPLVEGMTSRDPKIVIGLANGCRWLFEGHGARATIEESTFLAGSSGPQPSSQIVLRGVTAGGAEVHWAVSRIEEMPAEPGV
jgi:uncharacterized heparinase superfamily protein